MDLKKELLSRSSLFNEELNRFLIRENPSNLYDAARHLPNAGGKRLRPVLAMLACEAVGGKMMDVIPFALGVELVHNFSLVHDDIMDKSTLRRSLPTVHLEYGEPSAIIAGDLLFAKAFQSLNQYPENYEAFRRLYNLLICSVIEVCEGQQLDMNFERRFIVSEEEYLHMIEMKTSALFRIASEGGAIAGGAVNHIQKALRVYGTSLGLAFQIQDDFLDMSSDTETLGKDIGNDIRNGKKTLIAVHSLTHAEDDDKKVLKTFFGKTTATDKEVQQVHSVFKNVGSIDYAKQQAKAYSSKAKHALDILDESAAKQLLTDLAKYTIIREN